MNAEMHKYWKPVQYKKQRWNLCRNFKKRNLKRRKRRNVKTFEEFKFLTDKFPLFSFIFIFHSNKSPNRARIKKCVCLDVSFKFKKFLTIRKKYNTLNAFRKLLLFAQILNLCILSKNYSDRHFLAIKRIAYLYQFFFLFYMTEICLRNSFPIINYSKQDEYEKCYSRRAYWFL